MFDLTPLDALSQVLNGMRISGSLLVKEDYQLPWAVTVPESKQLNNLFESSNGVRFAAFHMVERGHINIKLQSGYDVKIEAGEMAVCFSGENHTLYQGQEDNAVPFLEIMQGSNRFLPEIDDLSGSTSLVCGVFMLHDTLLNPLFAALPKLLKFSTNKPEKFPRLYNVVKLLTMEFNDRYQKVGNNYVVQRYLEILCAEAIRVHVDRLPKHSKGWLSALKDPMIGRAIEIIHAAPGYHWSVKSIAEQVTISPSRFATKFRETLGESPMVYITKWRMAVASQMLEQNQHSIDQIANSVGYESLAAFSRAFKRHVGLPPATWRNRAS